MELSLFDSFGALDTSNNSSDAIQSSSIANEWNLGKRTLEPTNFPDEDYQSSKVLKIEESTDASSAPPVKRPPAKVYKFKLDNFQQEAVNYIDNHESVLVAAHTSAGKTAVAEYAIAKSLRDKQRVIYTSPIKALSNQKFRDLQEEFQDVGLMTGDMTINPNATCLIMTTEILRSMLYRGSEIVREVAWVIYDEVHYMRDKERGVVWEESIILLPHKVRFVFLSATIPNAQSFVSWVSKIHHQPCHVVYTDYRPVPLQHYLFPAAAEGLFLVVDEKSKFREDNFQRAMSSLQSSDNGMDSAANNSADKKSTKKVTKNLQNDLMKIVKLIMDRALDPCIIFSFSKKDCETYALQMAKFEFNNAEEKTLVEHVFMNAMESLSEDDKQLPQIITILPLLKRGIGIHHGGLLPILKEVIEILFQEGLIKVLFATETFSIGINMPAKTVVFTATRKYDGKDFRWITSGEYIQMSGRAGRRGKDDKGIVIQMIDEKMEPEIVKNMIYGASDPLYSSYHIGYNMVLNMLRIEDANPLHLIKLSFHQYQQETSAPQLQQQCESIKFEMDHMNIPQEEYFQEYVYLQHLLVELHKQINGLIMQPQHILPFLQSGRMIQIQYDNINFGWGTIVQAKQLQFPMRTPEKMYTTSKFIGGLKMIANGKQGNQLVPQTEYIIDVVIEVNRQTKQVLLGAASAEQGDSSMSTAQAFNTNQNASKAVVKIGHQKKTDNAVDANKIVSSFNQLEFGPMVLSSSTPTTTATTKTIKTEVASSDSNELLIIQVGLDAIGALSAIRLNIPKDMSKESSLKNVRNTLREIHRRFSVTSLSSVPTLWSNSSKQSTGGSSSSSSSVPILDYEKDIGIVGKEFTDLLAKQKEIEARLHDFQTNKLPLLLNHLPPTIPEPSSSTRTTLTEDGEIKSVVPSSTTAVALYKEGDVVELTQTQQEVIQYYYQLFLTKQALRQDFDMLLKQSKELHSVTMRDELKKMQRVLKQLDYITDENVLTMKGRFACEISAGDELVLTNMIFSGVFTELTVPQCVAILSCFVHNEGSGADGKNGNNNQWKYLSDLQKPYRQLVTIAKEMVKVYQEHTLQVDEEEYVNSFDPSLLDVTYNWCQGMSFYEICKLTDSFEGSIIRSIRRLEELLRQLASASTAIGNQELVQLFLEGANQIRRGVVFAASLYI